MTHHFKRTISIHLYKIVLAVLFVSSVLMAIAYWNADPTSKLASILSGMVTGLIVAFFQYLLSWNEHAEVEAIKTLGVIKILSHRDDKSYYNNLISRTEKSIRLLGNTASRFFQDFAHPTRDDSQSLLNALAKGVRLEILVPAIAQLPRSEKASAQNARARINELKTEFPRLVEIREFNTSNAHSILCLDADCLVGPIFPKIKSRDSPTIHVHSDSPLVAEYLNYFTELWNESRSV